jgi:hypothetical protein
MIIRNREILKRKKFWTGLLLAQFILFFIFSKINFTLHFFQFFFDLKKEIHQRIFSVFSFSVGDVFYILLGLFLFFSIIKILKKNTRNKHLLKLLIFLNIFYFIYQIFWGMLYFQQPLIEKLPNHEANLQEMKTLAIKYLERCKKTRMSVKEDKNGVFKINDQKKVEDEILNNQNFLPDFIDKKKITGINSFKPSIYKKILSYTGILGYYNPFTAEAQYNPELPNTFIPFTLAHESAHQLGFAREQEANFIGYLLGVNSKNPDIKYSTEYFVLKSLLNAIAVKDEEFAKSTIQSYSLEMKRDRIAEKIFIKKHEGFLDIIFGFTNDLFLKSNQQEGSITYSYFVDLLLRYESNNEEN